MKVPVITIRPEPGCGATAATAGNFGLAIECHPLSSIEPMESAVPEGSFDGILAGSANAFRMTGAHVDKLVDIPVYAVGEATAAAAWEKGFRTAAIGSGGLQNVLDDLAGTPLHLLRIAGEEHVPLDPPAGVTIATMIAYRAEAQPIDSALANTLRRGAIVLLHSAASARHFGAEVDRLGLDRGRLALAALGPRIAQAAGTGWARVVSAREPNDPALLALAREMCHEPFPGRDKRQ